MEPQTAPAPSAQVVGNLFVEQYYHILHHSPELVYRFYQDNSVLSRPDPNGLMATVTSMENINKTICSLDYQNYKAEIKTADSQESYENGVVVLVTGSLTGKDNLKRKFTQTFFLAPQDKGYYVCNDVFRYVEETDLETAKDLVASVEDTPPSSLTRDPEPPQLIDPPNVNHEPSRVEEVEIVEQQSNDKVIDEQEASDKRENVVEAESHVNENHVSAVVAESVTPTTQDDAPKKSYASILSSQTKKRPTKIYVPTNAAKVAVAKTVKLSVNPVEHGSASEASVPSAPVNASESKNIQDEEGHSVYIRNLPLNATVDQLEAEFIKFGPIKQNGVQVRSNKQQEFCFGFVEFQEFSSLQNAIKASPVTIGDRQATVEIKRTTTRVGSVKGRFTSSRGGFRNESFRGGRGNFGGDGGGGRTYVRSDSFRGGQGNHSAGGRDGECGGYQQGRGRGARRSSPNRHLPST